MGFYNSLHATFWRFLRIINERHKLNWYEKKNTYSFSDGNFIKQCICTTRHRVVQKE